MADSKIDATLEENRQLREQIEAVQQERRRNYADAGLVREEVLARQENERLQDVLDSQRTLLEKSELEKENAATPDLGSRIEQVPYTITADGPRYSTSNQGGTEEKSEERTDTRSSNSRPAAVAPRPVSGSATYSGTTPDAAEDKKEN